MEHTLQSLPERFPQLKLPIRTGMRETPAYKAAVLSGEEVQEEVPFLFGPGDSLTTAETPAGPAEILYLEDRERFLRAYRALGYRCEPAEIQPSVGAVALRGLIDWGKIRDHKEAYLAAGGEDWDEEFSRFAADKNNYLSALILLSGGAYSNIPAEDAGLDPETWLSKSLTIRKYHELTHFVCRGLYPEKIDVLRDEVLADLIGLVAAFGSYDAELARRFLGLENGAFHAGGRLSHYVTEEELPAAAARVDALIEGFAQELETQQTQNVFDLLLELF